MSWTLGNGEAYHAANPETLKAPDRDERASLQPGSFAKLIFYIEDNEIGCETMWVQVTQNVAEHYIGILDNEPIFIPDLKRGDKIAFKPENIISILPEDS